VVTISPEGQLELEMHVQAALALTACQDARYDRDEPDLKNAGDRDEGCVGMGRGSPRNLYR
jgi:hypothetical protein